MGQPLISVIIPIYNGASYIQKMVEMVKNQTYKNLEVLLIDDGSMDETAKLCKQQIEKDGRFTLFRKENGGASTARNYGLQRSHGEYIAFIDADDYIFPQYIEYLYSLLSKYHADMSCCGYYKMWDTEKLPDFEDSLKEIVFTGSEAIEDLLYRKNISASPCLKLYKVAVVENICFPEGVIYEEDMLFNLKAIENCRKVIYGDRVLYIYYQHLSSVTHCSVDVAQYKKSWDILFQELLGHSDKVSSNVVRAAQSKLFIFSVGNCCKIWKMNEAKNFRKELLDYMRTVDVAVLKDNKCKFTNRVLACLSCISAPMLVRICRLYTRIKHTFRFETRRPV